MPQPQNRHDADNSGALSYVRIEFAGYPFQKDKEINGLTLGSVGSGTGRSRSGKLHQR